MTEAEVIRKYPKIFKDASLPMTQTCMCWGLEVPDHWLPVIDTLCATLQGTTESLKRSYDPSKWNKFIRPRLRRMPCSHSKHLHWMIDDTMIWVPFPQVVAEQVKEKFWELRFYFRLEYADGTPDEAAQDMWNSDDSYVEGAIACASEQCRKLDKELKEKNR